MSDIEYVDVVAVKALPEFHLWVRFSNGREGVRDFRPMLAEGGVMVEPLNDKAVFEGVHVNYHVPTWPNGFEIDATNLHLEMLRDGLLTTSVAAEQLTTNRLKLTSIRAVVPFKLVVSFNDGSSGTFDAAPMIGERGEGTEPLRDRRFFGTVELKNGVPTWPNHFDISPGWLREEMEKRGELILPLPVRHLRGRAQI